MTRLLRVLHLEDSPRDAELVRYSLEGDGMSCDIHLANGKASFELALARESFDLIISDYNLPGYDGITALKQAQATQPDVPVILLSGTASEEQAVKCLQIGATDYLLKGRLDRLVPAVQRAILEAETRLTRKRAEMALAQSERRQAAILESVLDCIITMDAAGIVIELNAAAERTFGYTKAQAIGRRLGDLIIPPAFRAAHAAGLARFLMTDDGPLVGKVIEVTAVRSDGSELPVEMAITVIRSEQTPIFTGVLRDITARKRADETRTRLAAIVDSSDDAIFSMAMDGTILTWNAGAERLYGYTASEMIDRSRAPLAPAGRSVEYTTILEQAARGKAGEPFETQRMRKDGSMVDISLAISPMMDSIGRVTSVSAIARDITSRKKDEAQLKRLNDELQAERLRDAEVARKRTEELEHQVVERREAEAAVRVERDRAQRFLDTADVTLLALNVQGRITLINRSGCDLLGWTERELLGTDFIDTCVPARIRAETRRRFAEVLAGPDSSTVDGAIVTKSGEERMVEWRNTLLRNHEGDVVSTLSCGTDMTIQRRLDEERVRTADLEPGN